MTKILEIKLSIVYSPLDDALGSKANLKSKEGIATGAGLDVCELITKIVPEDSACSMIIGHKELS